MTKEELQNYRALQRESRQIREKLEKIETELYSLPAQQLTGMPAAPPKPGSTLEAAVAAHTENLEALRVRYVELLAKIEEQQLAVEQAIESQNSTARTLLRHRYLEGRKWEEICVLMGYSWRQVHRIHSAALIALKGEENE